MATIATMPGTLADVVRRLGGVPLDRIRARPAPGTATEDDLLKAGKPIFVGPIKDNTGKVVIEGTLGLYDGALWGTDYLIEGVVGSIT